MADGDQLDGRLRGPRTPNVLEWRRGEGIPGAVAREARRNGPDVVWHPALKRARQFVQRRRRRVPSHRGAVFRISAMPTEYWTANVEGQFGTGDGISGRPLTVADPHTPCVLTQNALPVVNGHASHRADAPLDGPDDEPRRWLR
jgi:hypothetical protein